MKTTYLISDSADSHPPHARKRALSVVLLLCLTGTALHAEATDKSSREREALRRMQQQLSQVQGQVGALEEEKTRMADDLDKAQKSSKSVESKAERLQRELGAGKRQQVSLTKELTVTREELATTTQRLAETQKALSETSNKLTDTTRTLQQTDAEKRNLESIKQRNERDIASCERKNVALYELGRSLMYRFENKSCAETLAQKEPFTGLKQVETENLLEEYRDKLDDQKLIKPPGG
ncbi:MAG: hypothetical protein ABL892_09695 [Thiobacillaceae bacterium]